MGTHPSDGCVPIRWHLIDSRKLFVRPLPQKKPQKRSLFSRVMEIAGKVSKWPGLFRNDVASLYRRLLCQLPLYLQYTCYYHPISDSAQIRWGSSKQLYFMTKRAIHHDQKSSLIIQRALYASKKVYFMMRRALYAIKTLLCAHSTESLAELVTNSSLALALSSDSYVTGPFICQMARMRYDSFICYMTHSYVTWLIYMWHDSFICDMTHSYATWLIHMWHDSFIRVINHLYVTWLLHVTWRLHMWHDSFICDVTHS